jgi:hypothetical protein
VLALQEEMQVIALRLRPHQSHHHLWVDVEQLGNKGVYSTGKGPFVVELDHQYTVW